MAKGLVQEHTFSSTRPAVPQAVGSILPSGVHNNIPASKPPSTFPQLSLFCLKTLRSFPAKLEAESTLLCMTETAPLHSRRHHNSHMGNGLFSRSSRVYDPSVQRKSFLLFPHVTSLHGSFRSSPSVSSSRELSPTPPPV